MKTGSKNIDQVFKDGLSNYEADVNPSVWNNIEAGLQTPSGSITSEAVRTTRMFGKMKLRNIISFAVITGAVILAILYFTGKKAEQPLGPVQRTISQPSISTTTDTYKKV